MLSNSVSTSLKLRIFVISYSVYLVSPVNSWGGGGASSIVGNCYKDVQRRGSPTPHPLLLLFF